MTGEGAGSAQKCRGPALHLWARRDKEQMWERPGKSRLDMGSGSGDAASRPYRRRGGGRVKRDEEQSCGGEDG